MLIAAGRDGGDPRPRRARLGAGTRLGSAAGRARDHLDAARRAAQPAVLDRVGSFSLVLLAQVAFIVHQIAFMEPLVGRAQAALSVSIMTVMAVIGRLRSAPWSTGSTRG